MRMTAWTGVVGAAGMVLGTLPALPPAPQAPRWGGPVVAAAGSFPPGRVPVAQVAPAAPDPEREIERLGRAAPRPQPLRRAFDEADDLARFALERVAAAAAGDGASQYFIYLALEQCRSFLHGYFEGTSANLERMAEETGLNAEELRAWQRDLERCRGFAAHDWSALGEALGPAQPGGAIEYASVWFERAAAAGHPTALAEQALRPGPYGTVEREAMLARALAGGDAEVYWLLFAHSGELQAATPGVPALAWLIVACRAGQDCSEEAPWYRDIVCTDVSRPCQSGRSALEHYWDAADPATRRAAMTQANEIEELIPEARWSQLPVPPLEHLDYRRVWARNQE